MKVTTSYPKSIPNVVIELTGTEALLLRHVIGKIGGDPANPIRRLCSPLWTELNKVPNMPSGTSGSNPCLERMLTGSLDAKREWPANWVDGWNRLA